MRFAYGILAILIIAAAGIAVAQDVSSKTAVHCGVPLPEKFSNHREILDWDTSLGSIRTHTEEEHPATIAAEVVFGYKRNDKAAATEITQKTMELKNFLRSFFSQKTAESLQPTHEEQLKQEILQLVNSSVLENSKIADVRFLSLDVQR